MRAPPDLPRIVIVGAGFGGLRAAQGLAKARARVTVIDRFNHHLFQPLLYQVATAGLSPAQIASPVRRILRNQSNTEVLLGEVTGVDLARREVLLEPETRVRFDYLVLATGSKYSYFGHPEWSKRAPSLKTVQDALHIRERLLRAFESAEREERAEARTALLSIVVVGAGPTGVELAGAIAELAHKTLARDFRRIRPAQARVLLVEAGQRILASFPERLAAKAERRLRELGVEVRTGQRVEQIGAEGVAVGGERIAAATVLWAAGVAASPAGKWLGVEMDRAGRVHVDPDLSVPGHPEVFVIGDTALVKGSDGKPLPGLAPVAMQEGSYVAKVILERLTRPPGTSRPFRYRDRGNLATVGRAFAIADLGWIKSSGLIAWVLWLLVHILYLIGFRNKLTVMIEWAWAYATYERGARLITEP